MRRTWIPIVALAAVGLACEGNDREITVGDDTLRMEVPEDASERLERTGRRIGGRVGEAMEETGRAIEEAGRRVQEEVADSL